VRHHSLLLLLPILLACGSAPPRDDRPSAAADGREAPAESDPGTLEANAPRRELAVVEAPHARSRASYLEEANLLERANAYIEAIEVYDELFLAHPSFPEREEALKRRTTLLAFVDLARESYAKALAAETLEDELQYVALIQSFWPGYADVGLRVREGRSGRRLPPPAPDSEDGG